jgi:hypothetical protein
MGSAPFPFDPHPLKALIKMESAPYPLSPLDHFCILGIFTPHVQPLNLELNEISIFNENLLGKHTIPRWEWKI